ncbi:hypothetical protein NQ315_009433 [Exocentrus adspersus]|uniref:Ig-like domain-containing protein n=1 Tax=Exocentrus adspersus TaxID=1586481 RepID=A0AAV8WGX3_9CUCU|nr:hypothetical protein NQ315_009433 [Exocentrus adspersus]
MAAVYTFSVFLRLLLLVFVLQDVTGGVLNATKGHFRRKDFEDERFNRREALEKNRPHGKDANQVQSNPVTKEDIFTEVLGQTRTRVVLHCDTNRLETPGKDNITVIWVKVSNDSFTILTDGKRVVTRDKRFFVDTDRMNPNVWDLYIRYTKWEDAGMYKCQICAASSSGNSIFVKLNLIEAYAEIIGSAVRQVDKVGSPLRLSCELKDSLEAPRYIYWYHEERMINFDLNDGANVRQGRQGSELIFPRAEESHSGNYSCVPSNARPASVTVIVNGR